MTPHIDWSEGIRGLLLGPESLWNIRCYHSPLWDGLHKITISCRRRSLSIVAGRMELQGSPGEAGLGSAERCVLGFRHFVGHGGLACCALEAGWDFG